MRQQRRQDRAQGAALTLCAAIGLWVPRAGHGMVGAKALAQLGKEVGGELGTSVIADDALWDPEAAAPGVEDGQLSRPAPPQTRSTSRSDTPQTPRNGCCP